MNDLGLLWIRQYYRVPAKVGARIRFDHPPGKQQFGNVVGSTEGQYLLVDFGGKQGRQMLHPTWQVTYLDGGES